MRATTFLSIALTGLLVACSSPSGAPADRVVYRTSEARAPTLGAMAQPDRTPSNRTQSQPFRPSQSTRVGEMTEAERIAWFESHGAYPHPYSPSSERQSLGYVNQPTDWGWVVPAIVTAGAIYGAYRVKRHNDWDW